MDKVGVGGLLGMLSRSEMHQVLEVWCLQDCSG